MFLRYNSKNLIMKIYELNEKQIIKLPIEAVFNFFSKPENLAVITPSKLDFKILTPTPIVMNSGTLIDYTIRVMGFTVHWRTLITEYNPPYNFVDEQIKGPYTFWHHTHTFKEIDGGVEISDNVQYAIPMGIIGGLLHSIYIRNDLKKIFSHRKTVIDNILSNVENVKEINTVEELVL